MGRKRDVFWQYVDTEDGNKCHFCGQGIPGASRIKFHLAREKGGGISGCDNVPSDVQSEAASVINKNSSKRVKQSITSSNLDDNIINSNLSSDSSRGKIEGHLLPTTDLVGEQFQRNVKQIWEWLKKDDVSPVMGVWGMGGVGKTALLKHIHNKLLNDNHNVIWVTVSQNSILEIQRAIAKSIDADLSDEDDKMKISGKLLDAFKRIDKCVIILDDVWSPVLLGDMGVPLINNGIRVIVTSRSFDVCTSMLCKRNVVKVELLSIKEARDLFAKNLEDDGTLPSETIKIAPLLADECGGLPLAIVTIANNMRGRTNIRDWRNALSKLKSIEKGQDDIKRFVFPVLKSSFDHLNNRTLEDCLLCMALYCKDGKCTRKKLTRIFVDEGLIGRQDLEAQLDECQSILNKLINNSLLNEESPFSSFEFHGLVQAMAVSIGKESHGYMVMTELPDEQEWKADFQKVSLSNNDNIVEILYEMSPRCPRLSTFLMTDNYRLKVIPDNFFTNMPSLKILDLSYNYRIEGLPVSISNLECLTILLVSYCVSLQHIPSLAKLRRLRRLDLHRTAITEVPQGFENLTNLRWLNLLETSVKLKAQDIEGLKMLESIAVTFDSKDDFNAYVQIIGARIEDEVPMRGYFLQLGRYDAFRCIKIDINKDKVVIFDGVENSTLKLPSDINELQVYFCHQWKSMCDVLSSDEEEYELNISRCTVASCNELNYLFCSSDYCPLCYSLQGLNALYLDRLDSLSMLCKEYQVPPRICPFSCVRILSIHNCKGIKTLMTPGMSRQLHNLEELIVELCDSMEEIFSPGRNINREVDIDDYLTLPCDSLNEVFSLESNNEVEMDQIDVEAINLPSLKSVRLSCLIQLKSVCKGTMRCGSLQKFEIFYCPKLERLPQTQPSLRIDVWLHGVKQSHA